MGDMIILKRESPFASHNQPFSKTMLLNIGAQYRDKTRKLKVDQG